MIRAARAVYFTALGIWVGGMATLAFVVAPTVFRTAPRASAGTIFGEVLRSFGPLQFVLAMLCGAAVILLIKGGELRWRQGLLRIGALVLMGTLVGVAHFGLGPAIVRERESIPNFDSIPAGVPAKARFDRLHQWSVRVAGATLVTGVVLLVVSAAASRPSDGA